MLKRKHSILRYIVFISSLIQLSSNFFLSSAFADSSLQSLENNIYFLPAGITFLIWIPIITLSAVYGFLQLPFLDHHDRKGTEISTQLIIVFNSFWLWLLLASRVGEYFSPEFRPNYLVGTIIVIGIMLFSLANVYTKLDAKENETSLISRVRKVLIGVYFGWISVATVVNITSYLYAMSFSLVFSNELWAMIITSMVSILGITTINRTRNVSLKWSYAITLLWALLGIMIRNFILSTAVFWTAFIAFTAILATLIWNRFYQKYIKKIT